LDQFINHLDLSTFCVLSPQSINLRFYFRERWPASGDSTSLSSHFKEKGKKAEAFQAEKVAVSNIRSALKYSNPYSNQGVRPLNILLQAVGKNKVDTLAWGTMKTERHLTLTRNSVKELLSICPKRKKMHPPSY